MDQRPLGRTGVHLSRLGWGAFKIGRNVGTKYPTGYDLPDDDAVARLLAALPAMGVTYIDTAPAYGSSEMRLGRLMPAGSVFTISTKVGETFDEGESDFDFSADAVRVGVARSVKRLRRPALDLVLIHSDGGDRAILEHSGAVESLRGLRDEAAVRAIGFSGKTVEGNRAALAWADAIMVEYHADDRSHEPVIEAAASRGVAVIVKKGLASGRLDPESSIRFVLSNPGVTSLVIGSLSIEHMRRNAMIAASCGA